MPSYPNHRKTNLPLLPARYPRHHLRSAPRLLLGVRSPRPWTLPTDTDHRTTIEATPSRWFYSASPSPHPPALLHSTHSLRTRLPSTPAAARASSTCCTRPHPTSSRSSQRITMRSHLAGFRVARRSARRTSTRRVGRRIGGSRWAMR